jgi:hypothetical protein
MDFIGMFGMCRMNPSLRDEHLNRMPGNNGKIPQANLRWLWTGLMKGWLKFLALSVILQANYAVWVICTATYIG